MSKLTTLVLALAWLPTLASAKTVTYRCLLFGKNADTCRVRIGFDAKDLVSYQIHCLKGPRFEDQNSTHYKIEPSPRNGYTLFLGYPASSHHPDQFVTVQVDTGKPGKEWPYPTGIFKSTMEFPETYANLDSALTTGHPDSGGSGTRPNPTPTATPIPTPTTTPTPLPTPTEKYSGFCTVKVSE
jgi:hypothetical protein